MKNSANHSRLAKPHFDVPLLFASYMLALYGVFAVTIANYNPTLGSDRSIQQLVMDAANGRLQLTWVVVSMVGVAIIIAVKYDIIGRLWPMIYGIEVLLLTVVLTIIGEMVVTPREIDEMVSSLSNVLALSLNIALQSRLSRDEIIMLTHETQ